MEGITTQKMFNQWFASLLSAANYTATGLRLRLLDCAQLQLLLQWLTIGDQTRVFKIGNPVRKICLFIVKFKGGSK